MSKTPIKRLPNSRIITRLGFTLIELLVVIVIVAILFSYTLLAIRSDSAEDIIKQEAQRFNRLLHLSLEEAVLKNTEYGIEFGTKTYRFLQYTNNTWKPLQADKLLRKRELPHDMELELAVEEVDVIIGGKPEDPKDIDDDSQDENESEDKLQQYKPQVFVLSSEEITPEFSVRFFIPGVEMSYTVSGFIDGQHQLEVSEF